LGKAFGQADLPQLTMPIPRGMGIVWLLAAMLCGVSVVALFVWPRGWWYRPGQLRRTTVVCRRRPKRYAAGSPAHPSPIV
jgi:hypothetical protein